MATLEQRHPACLRYARPRAYRLSQKIDSEILGFSGDYIPRELSVKESCVTWDEESQEGTSAWTFRFEGGNVVRLNIFEWYDGNFGMYFRDIRNASLMFYPQENAETKDRIFLDQEYFSQKWEKLPPSICEKVVEILDNFNLEPSEESLMALVQKVQEAGCELHPAKIEVGEENFARFDQEGLICTTLQTNQEILEKATLAYYGYAD